jgi:hypothetical protein
MQFYQDESVFPNKYSDWIGNDTGSVSIKKDYIQILPGDPKTGEVCLGSGTTTVCDYVYNV